MSRYKIEVTAAIPLEGAGGDQISPCTERFKGSLVDPSERERWELGHLCREAAGGMVYRMSKL